MKSGTMNRLFALSCVLSGLTLASTVNAAANIEAGQAKAASVCVACHGLDGNSVNPEWPSIAGQHASYISKQVKAFRGGQRTNSLMSPIALTLTDQEIEDVAAYYSTQKPKGLEADKSKMALGEKIYRGGIADKQVPACLACHGPNGRGNPAANYPSIKGQHAKQVSMQLTAYQKGERKTDQNEMMRTIAARLTDDQIDALAAYVQGLR